MSRRTGNTNLVTLGSAAVLAVYAAGYVRTKPAADRLEEASAASVRRHAPTPEVAPPTVDAQSAEESAQSATVASDSGAPNPAPTIAPNAAPSKTSAPKAKTSVAADIEVGATKTAVADSAAKAVASAAVTPSVAPAIPASVVAVAPPTATAVPPTTPDSTTEPVPAAKPFWKDGVYTGRGRSRHGDIEATVEIQNHRIVSAVISQCLTRYSCSWINPLLPQVVARQSADVDVVSGATESANALYYAVLQALAFAK